MAMAVELLVVGSIVVLLLVLARLTRSARGRTTVPGTVSEAQARKNAAPLTTAILARPAEIASAEHDPRAAFVRSAITVGSGSANKTVRQLADERQLQRRAFGYSHPTEAFAHPWPCAPRSAR